MSHLERACEEVDASVFGSDMMFDPERYAMFKDYLGRWSRAVAEHEKAEQPAQQNPSRYQELREVLEDLMSWQVKNVDKWHNGAYDQASKVLKRHDAAPQPPAQPLTDEQIEQICIGLWSGGWRSKAMQNFARAIEAAHGIAKGNT